MMYDDDERVMAQIDRMTARETWREQTARWNDVPVAAVPYALIPCPRCGCKHDTQVCGFCGRDRTDTLATTEDDA